MLILSIDAATPSAGVAVADEEKILYEAFANHGLKHSRTLLGMIDVALQHTESRLGEVDAIGITIGPGSFTGLRIGLATAKGLALAAGKPIIGVPTLDALANNVSWCCDLVCPILNARKGEVYTAFYAGNQHTPARLSDYMALDPVELAVKCREYMEQTGSSQVTLLGDGVDEYAAGIKDHLGQAVLIPPEHCRLPRPSSVAMLAVQRFKAGQLDDALVINPFYVRLSEAEARLEKLQGEV